VNSERVVGPDLASGVVDPNTAVTPNFVQYTRVETPMPTGPDQYSINYATNTVTFAPSYVPSSVQIAFNYQNNLTVSGSTYSTDTIRSSYYTAAIIRLNLGVRVYAAATGYSEYFTLNSQVGVGNARAN